MDIDEFLELARDAISTHDQGGAVVRMIQSFEDVGYLTRDKGLVVRLDSGDIFDITIIHREVGRDV